MKRLMLLLSLLAFATLVSAAAALNVNSATESQLAAVPAIGAVKARAIVEYRYANGCFTNIKDLLKVPGVTQANLDALGGVVEVGTCPRSIPAPAKAQT